MTKNRAAGVLLHPTSFPGPYGIGDLGENAYRFIDFLKQSGQKLWQVLPLGPTGYGDSPYASFSSFAGNPLLINLDVLVKDGLLSHSDIYPVPAFPEEQIDYGWVIHWKFPLLEKAAKNFIKKNKSSKAYADFKKEKSFWLQDYALFRAVKNHYDQKAAEEGVSDSVWFKFWDKDIATREPKALDLWRTRCAEEIEIRMVWQFLFFKQWHKLKTYANQHGVEIIGDIPIFVAPDSVDAWANPDLFLMDKDGTPSVVAGVPPDYFSATGQLWGNPLYNWDAMKANGFKWWIQRIHGNLDLVDIIRIDHFRGLEAFYAVPKDAKTAEKGKWVKAPGYDLFNTIKEELGSLPILAEDLGFITPEVHAFREHFEFPGMKILQFAFDIRESGGIDGNNIFLPHNHSFNSVVYTGTHDNDTTRGWYNQRSEEEKDMIRRYLGRDDHDIVWEFIRMALQSVARYAIVPMQDLLQLDSWARMNMPSTLGGNWSWRYVPHHLDGFMAGRLKDLTRYYGR